MRAAFTASDLSPIPRRFPATRRVLPARPDDRRPADSPGEECGDVRVCSPEWLAGAWRQAGGLCDARHQLVVNATSSTSVGSARGLRPGASVCGPTPGRRSVNTSPDPATGGSRTIGPDSRSSGTSACQTRPGVRRIVLSGLLPGKCRTSRMPFSCRSTRRPLLERVVCAPLVGARRPRLFADEDDRSYGCVLAPGQVEGRLSTWRMCSAGSCPVWRDYTETPWARIRYGAVPFDVFPDMTPTFPRFEVSGHSGMLP